MSWTLVQAASNGGNKENRPKVARAKREKRAKRTSKASAADSMIDLVVSMQLPLICCSALCSAAMAVSGDPSLHCSSSGLLVPC